MAEILHGRSGKTEAEMRALALLIEFINANSTVPSLKKNDQHDRKDKEDEDKRGHKGGDVVIRKIRLRRMTRMESQALTRMILKTVRERRDTKEGVSHSKPRTVFVIHSPFHKTLCLC